MVYKDYSIQFCEYDIQFEFMIRICPKKFDKNHLQIIEI